MEGEPTVKRKPPQLEINWGEAESFALVVQQTIDGDRVAAEKTQQTKDRHEADKHQLKLTNEPDPH